MYQIKFSLPTTPPASAQQLVDQALALHQTGNLQRARDLYEQALRLHPGHADALHLLGVVDYTQGNHEKAVERISKSVAIYPDNPAARLNLGNALRAIDRLAEAQTQYDAALALNANYVNALVAKAVVLDELERWDESLDCFSQALALQGNSATTYFNRGNGYRKRCLWKQAVADYDHALNLQPDFVQALLNRGSVYHEQLQLDCAVADFDAAIAAAPEHAEAHFNKALTLLLRGDFAAGLPLHEWRWKTTGARGEDRQFPQPQWTGQTSLSGITILLHAEQGLGDSIQFARYAQLLASAGARVVLEVPVPLASLLKRVQGVDSVVRRGETLPVFDVHCPLLSLPLALGTRVDTIPAMPCYLSADAQRRARWSTVLGPRTVAARVGLVWSGSTWHTNDRNRSMRLAHMLAHLPVGPEYISLQRDVRDSDLITLAATSPLRHFGPELTDFEETAALCSLMDMVITVDTSVAHLAGALGKPTWLLLPFVPDWRWLLHRDDSPWYPSMRLLRQDRPGDWDSPLQRAAQALTAV